jgi:hypothetical protein
MILNVATASGSLEEQVQCVVSIVYLRLPEPIGEMLILVSFARNVALPLLARFDDRGGGKVVARSRLAIGLPRRLRGRQRDRRVGVRTP